MSAQDHLGPQFPYEIRQTTSNVVKAYHQNKMVGGMWWEDAKPEKEVWAGRRNAEGKIEDVLIKKPAEPPKIGRIQVDPEHQRKGVATALLKHARSVDPALTHSSDLSADGAAWAKARP